MIYGKSLFYYAKDRTTGRTFASLQFKNIFTPDLWSEIMFFDFYEKSFSFLDIEKYLIPAGFHLYDINYISKNPMNGRTDWADVIYVNKNRYK